jgi:hypothetical protein
MEQVLVRIGGKSQLRKESNRCVHGGGSPGKVQCPLEVESGVSHAQQRDTNRYADKTVRVNRVKCMSHNVGRSIAGAVTPHNA